MKKDSLHQPDKPMLVNCHVCLAANYKLAFCLNSPLFSGLTPLFVLALFQII